MLVGQWGDIKFEIAANSAVLFSDMKLSASTETEDLDSNGQKYVGYKNGKAITVSMKILLYAGLGTDVRNAILILQNAAQRGTQEYLVIGGKKLYPFQLMLTKAEADKITISPAGEWTWSEVSVTWSQSSAEHIFETEGATETAWVDTGDWGSGSGGGVTATKKIGGAIQAVIAGIASNASTTPSTVSTSSGGLISTAAKIGGAISRISKR